MSCLHFRQLLEQMIKKGEGPRYTIYFSKRFAGESILLLISIGRHPLIKAMPSCKGSWKMQSSFRLPVCTPPNQGFSYQERRGERSQRDTVSAVCLEVVINICVEYCSL